MLWSDKQHQQIHFYLLVLFCFFLPLWSRIAVFSLILLVLNALGSGMLWRNRRQALGPWPLLFSSFYFLHLFGMLYTHNTAEGLLDLETKLTFLLLPPVLFAMPFREATDRAKVLQAFLAGCITATLYAYTCASLLYLRTGLNAFYYEYLSGYVNAHPSYLAIYLIFALFLVLEKMGREMEHWSWQKKGLYALLIGHFIIFIFLLTARMQLLVCIFLLAVSLMWYMTLRGKRWQGLLAFLLFLTVSGGLSLAMPYTRMRLLNAYQQALDPSVAPNVRVPIWRAGWELFRDSPLIGHGTGDVQDNLERLYARDGVTKALEYHYNAHNQFVQTSIALGLLGLLCLLSILFLPLLMAIRREKYIYAFFLGLIALSLLTECILEREQGILFYAFFNSFLALSFLEEEQKGQKKTGE